MASLVAAVAIWHRQLQRWLCGISGVADATLSLGEDYLMTPPALPLTHEPKEDYQQARHPGSQLKCVKVERWNM